jgi:ubiquinone/menaquinone biosynthesis C-methylase UbiE
MRAHGHIHPGNTPAIFRGRGSWVYDMVARRLLRRLYRKIAEDVVEAAPVGASVLDVGTGPGVLLVEIARRRNDLELTGIDLSDDMVAAANRNLREFGDRAIARVGDVTDLGLPDQSFDLIVSSFSLHHWDDPEAAVPELARVLRPGGRLHIYDMQRAPFDLLVSSARERSLFAGGSSRQSVINTGIPFFRRCTRQVMVAEERHVER